MEKVAKWLRRLTNELEPFISKERLQFITEELEAAEYGVVFDLILYLRSEHNVPVSDEFRNEAEFCSNQMRIDISRYLPA